jgi:hypothetical protein
LPGDLQARRRRRSLVCACTGNAYSKPDGAGSAAAWPPANIATPRRSGWRKTGIPLPGRTTMSSPAYYDPLVAAQAIRPSTPNELSRLHTPWANRRGEHAYESIPASTGRLRQTAAYYLACCRSRIDYDRAYAYFERAIARPSNAPEILWCGWTRNRGDKKKTAFGCWKPSATPRVDDCRAPLLAGRRNGKPAEKRTASEPARTQ